MSWNAVYAHLLLHPAGTVLPIAKAALADPRLCGAEVSVGWPSGQSADYRFPPDAACRGLHVHEFADRWRQRYREEVARIIARSCRKLPVSIVEVLRRAARGSGAPVVLREIVDSPER